MTRLTLCKFPLFSTMKFTLGRSLFQFILRFEIGIFECGLKLFPNSEKNGKLVILNVALVGLHKFFPTHERDELLEFLSVSLGCT